jgi:hypothetical protein
VKHTPPATEPFGRPPRRLADALATGELTFWGYGILSWLEHRANHNYDPPTWSGTLAGMADAIDWPNTHDHLSKELRRLRDGDWIWYESVPGRRGYEIELRRSLVATSDEPRTKLGSDQGVSSEVTSDEPRSDDTARRDRQGDRGTHRARTGRGPQTRRDQTRRDESKTSLVNPSDGVRSDVSEDVLRSSNGHAERETGDQVDRDQKESGQMREIPGPAERRTLEDEGRRRAAAAAKPRPRARCEHGHRWPLCRECVEAWAAAHPSAGDDF